MTETKNRTSQRGKFYPAEQIRPANSTGNSPANSAAQPLSLTQLEQKARSGKTVDVDVLLGSLHINQNFLRCKLVDYALGLVSTPEGRERIRHFLFNGNKIQRNYAALYFKRLGAGHILDEAVEKGCIDTTQAYAE